LKLILNIDLFQIPVQPKKEIVKTNFSFASVDQGIYFSIFVNSVFVYLILSDYREQKFNG